MVAVVNSTLHCVSVLLPGWRERGSGQCRGWQVAVALLRHRERLWLAWWSGCHSVHVWSGSCSRHWGLIVLHCHCMYWVWWCSLTHCCAWPERAVATSTTSDPAPMTTANRLCTRDPLPPVVSSIYRHTYKNSLMPKMLFFSIYDET